MNKVSVPLFLFTFGMLLFPMSAHSAVTVPTDVQACMLPQALVGSTANEVKKNCLACTMQVHTELQNDSPEMRMADDGICHSAAVGWCQTVNQSNQCSPILSLNKGCKDYVTSCGKRDDVGVDEIKVKCAEGLTAKDDGKCYCSDGVKTASVATECKSPDPKPKKPIDVGGGDDGKITGPADPGGPGGDSPGGAIDGGGLTQQQAQQDIESCASSRSTTHRCCVADPLSCVSGGSNAAAAIPPPQQTGDPAKDQAAIQQYCQQLKTVGAAGTGANQSAGDMCFSKYKACEQGCAALANKWESARGGDAGLIQQTAQTLRSMVGSCTSYSNAARQLGTQGIYTNAGSAGGGLCSNVSQANPSSMMPQQQQQADALNEAQQKALAAMGCDEDPTKTGCEGYKKTDNDRAGEASFGNNDDAMKRDSSDFNLQNMGDMQGGMGNGIGGGIQPQAVTNGTIANNSGGGIPGGGGGSPASLGPNGRGGSPGSPGYNTDIMSANASGGSGGGGSAGGSGYQPQSAEGNNGTWNNNGGRGPAAFSASAVDLKRYLPGNELDPNYRIGGFDGVSAQINNKYTDLWKKVSNRIQEKCKLGVLYDCK